MGGIHVSWVDGWMHADVHWACMGGFLDVSELAAFRVCTLAPTPVRRWLATNDSLAQLLSQ